EQVLVGRRRLVLVELLGQLQRLLEAAVPGRAVDARPQLGRRRRRGVLGLALLGHEASLPLGQTALQRYCIRCRRGERRRAGSRLASKKRQCAAAAGTTTFLGSGLFPLPSRGDRPMNAILKQLHKVLGRGADRGVSDADLLGRYLSARD